jgi:hypothetical protein
MDARAMRALIYLFGGLIVVFFLLMLVNYLGSFAGPREGLPGQDPGEESLSGAEAEAREALAAASSGITGRSSMIPAARRGLSTASVTSEGAIRLIKEKDFDGVAEKPKGMMEALNELAGGDKRKPAPIRLSDADLDRKVRDLGAARPRERGVKVSSMPELGRGSGQEGVTLLAAPVDYKVFRSSETWWAFANSRKLKPGPHDFAAFDLVILVSLSDFPSGIFSVAGVEPGRKETLVKYRVNPLAMAAETDPGRREAYASAPVPRGIPVRLQQVP